MNDSNTVLTTPREPIAAQGLEGREAQTRLPPHLVRLPGEHWALWRCVALRGAGFHAAGVYKLASPESAAVADEYIAAADAAARASDEALAALRSELETADDERRALLIKRIRRLKRGSLTEPPGTTDAAAEALRAARLELDRARECYLETFAVEALRVSGVFRELAADERFREAVIWQNRHAYQTALEPLLRHAPTVSRGSKQRQREELIANYWQRYCVKNDTIGFFGPVGWARLVDQGEAVEVRTGPGFLAERHVRFETWCMEALAETLNRGQSLKQWVAPRRSPFIYLDGATLYLPFKRPATLTPELAAVLRVCDGERSAKEIARELAGKPGLKLRTEKEVFQILEALRSRELISWGFAVPVPYRLHPEQTFRRLCERIQDRESSAPVLEALDRLEAARRAVAEAAGHASQLDRALGELEATFTALTGKAPTKSDGDTYASRTLIYEDCRRGTEVELGAELPQALGTPLSLLLSSARWLTYEVAARYRRAFEQTYAQLARRLGSPVIEAATFWTAARPLLYGEDDKLLHAILLDFQARWSKILSIDPRKRGMNYASEELRPKVLAAFDAPRAGWPYARFHSPDVMIAAPSAEAIRRGDYLFVLGECHTAEVTLGSWIFVGQHPRPDELQRYLDSDLPPPRVVPVVPKHQAGLTTRTSMALLSPEDFYLEYSFEPSDVPPARALPLGALVIEKREEGLIVRTRDGQPSFDVIDFLSGALTSLVLTALKILPPASHTPRVTFDRLVVSRETWNFSPSELTFARETDEAERFVAARRWMRAHGLPRLVFVKTPMEVKPFFVDFESPTFVNILAKMVRHCLPGAGPSPHRANLTEGRIIISEMLPTPEQTWLKDLDGMPCTSEFRFVALDLKSL